MYLLGKHPYKILSFDTVEKSYLQKGTNHRSFQWQTITQENGEIYQFKLNTNKKATKRLIKEPNRFLFLANNAGIFSHEGIIYNQELNAIVTESLENHGNGIAYCSKFLSITYQKEQIIKGLSLSICSILSNGNYAHFLLDAIPKLYLAKKILPDVDHILVSGSGTSFQKKIFDYLKLSQKVIWLEHESHFECEQLLFTSRLNNTTHACPWVVKATRNLFLQNIQLNNTALNSGKVIFASRKSASKRKTFLEDLVLAQLTGVEIVDFGELSILETIKVCQECSLFIGFHGAAFANLAFCNPGIKVIEFQLESSLNVNCYYFYSLAKHLKMNHQMITLSESMSALEIKVIVDKNINKYAECVL